MKVFDSWPSFAGQEVHCASWPSFAGQEVHCASWPSFAGQVHCVSWPSFAGQVQTVDAIGAAYFDEVPITFIAEIQKKICEWDTATSWTIKINDKERERESRCLEGNFRMVLELFHVFVEDSMIIVYYAKNKLNHWL